MIDEKDFAILDMRYKKLEDCDRDMRMSEQDSAEIKKDIAIMQHQQKINNWLTAAIASGIVALVIKVFLGA